MLNVFKLYTCDLSKTTRDFGYNKKLINGDAG